MTSDNRARPPAGRRTSPARRRITASLNRIPGKARDVLSSPNALAAAALVAVVALVLALYVVFAQINLTNCLASYNEASARSTAARAQAAAEDRNSDLEERNLAEIERQRQAANDVALDRVLMLMGKQAAGTATQTQLTAAFRTLLLVRGESARIRADNQVKRGELVQRRAATEARRAANPVPDPPSTMCGGKTSTK